MNSIGRDLRWGMGQVEMPQGRGWMVVFLICFEEFRVRFSVLSDVALDLGWT